eukprot:5468011-Pleurochrysis_carterae.AAC.1
MAMARRSAQTMLFAAVSCGEGHGDPIAKRGGAEKGREKRRSEEGGGRERRGERGSGGGGTAMRSARASLCPTAWRRPLWRHA